MAGDDAVLFGPVVLARPLHGPPVNCPRGISTCSETGGSVNFTLRLLVVLLFAPTLPSPRSTRIGDSIRFRIDSVGDALLGEGANFFHGLIRLMSG